MEQIGTVGRTRPSWADTLLGGKLAGSDLEALLDAGRMIRQRPRTTLLRAEEDRALLLIRGTVKAHIVAYDGDELITAIRGPGYAAGLLMVLGNCDTGTDVTSLEPVEALTVPGPDLRALIVDDRRRHPGITHACLATVAAQHADAHAERTRFAGTAVPERVASRLVELATGWGHADGDFVHITLSLTQAELAAWCGASRESVAKVLQDLRTARLLATGRRSLTVLDLPRLRERCEHAPAGACHQVGVGRPSRSA